MPVADRWRGLVAEVERASPSLGSALKQAVLLSLAEGEVSVRMPAGLPLTNLERRRGEVEAVLARVLGRPTKLAIVQGAPSDVAAPAAAPGVPARSIAEVEQAERDARAATVRAAAKAHPNIQEAVRILDGEVTKIEEL